MEIEGAAGTSYSSSSVNNAAFAGGGGGGEAAVDRDGGGGEENGIYLAWENLSVVLPNIGKGQSKRLLQGINGYAEPGRILAIMGPSGSGKSTLIDSLAGRLSRNVVMTGNILFNGKTKRVNYGVIAYVTQEDVLLGTLTVKETLTYSALFRLPSTMTKLEVADTVEGVIDEMGLQDCADTLIGNWHLRGISGGEKKRLSIALEILTRPRLLFLDEPTSGLDSASSFFVIKTLRNIARDGRAVISSIHQPSSEVFALFDDLCLLSSGQIVYFGEAKMALEFFAEAGFHCPKKRNPSDHFLRCINSDFDAVTATLKGSMRVGDVPQSSDPFMNMPISEIKARLVEKYCRSNYSEKTKKRIGEISAIKGLEVQGVGASQASWLKQLSALTRRSFLNMTRDVGYYWARIMVYIVVSFCVGTIFYDLGYTYLSIWARVSCGAFVIGFMSFMSIGGFPSFIEEMKVFTRERLNGYYGVGVYILSNFISSLPYLVVISMLTGTITYSMVKYYPTFMFSHYVHNCLQIFLCIGVVESMMMIVASLVPNYLMGVLTGAGVIGIVLISSGFYRLLPDLPKPFWRYPISYISFAAWGMQGGFKNHFIGLEFEPLIPGDPKISGEFIIQTRFGADMSISKWADAAAIFVILVGYRLIFFIVLKLKEQAFPLFNTLYKKKVIKQLDMLQESFRKIPALASKRHENPYPLTSQEGLDSPFHH